MFSIKDDMSIHVTRGDVVYFNLSMEQGGEVRPFAEGDIVRMKIFAKKNCKDVVMIKDFRVTEQAQTIGIELTGLDTKFGDVISKPTDYWYEIELNPDTVPQTIVGYGEEGAMVFRLYPEGREMDGSDLEPGDIPWVDSELDEESSHPIQNQATAKAIAELRLSLEGKLSKMGGTMSGSINMGGNWVKNLADPIMDGDAVPLRYAREHFMNGGESTPSSADWDANITGYERTDITPTASNVAWMITGHEQVDAYYPMDIGDTVYITVDGVEYEARLKRQDFFGKELYLYAGDPALNPSYNGNSTNEPYLFYISPEMGAFGVYVRETSAVKVEWLKPIVKDLLPARYLRYDYAPRVVTNDLSDRVSDHDMAILSASSEMLGMSQTQTQHEEDIAALKSDVINLNKKNSFQDTETARIAGEIAEIREQLESYEPSTGFPGASEEDNGKIPMVVDGAIELVDFPAGTQYELKTITIKPTDWLDNGSAIHYIWYNDHGGEYWDLSGCSVDVSPLSTSTKEQFETMAESGAYCYGSTAAELEFRCLYSVPTVELSFAVRITKPTTLSYAVNEENMTMTIVEEDVRDAE